MDNRKGRKTGPSDEDKCFKCGKGGHWYFICKIQGLVIVLMEDLQEEVEDIQILDQGMK